MPENIRDRLSELNSAVAHQALIIEKLGQAVLSQRRMVLKSGGGLNPLADKAPGSGPSLGRNFIP